MLTRRNVLKLGLASAGSLLGAHDGPLGPVRPVYADDAPSSPRVTPFVDPLPVPPVVRPVDAFFDFPGDAGYGPFIGARTRYFRIVAEERLVRFHRDWGQTSVWGYRDDSPASPFAGNPWPFALGPTLAYTIPADNVIGGGMLVRHVNDLPRNHRGFGVPITTTHLHGGHHPARADGFPADLEGLPPFLTMPGGRFDYLYPTLDTGYVDFNEGSTDPIDATERPSTMWYHDHLIDFTAQNVYRGLAGFSLTHDALDSGNELDTEPGALRLPSGAFDIPLVLQDRRFNRDYSLWYDPFDHDGFIGDRFAVNGVIQPFLETRRRRYRFRVLNGSNARIYTLFLANAGGQTFPMTQIATEGGLLSSPIPNVRSLMVSPAERVEVVVDFGAPEFAGQQALFLENRLQMDEGRKPDGLRSRGTPLLKFAMVGGAVSDPSRVGKLELGRVVLRRFEPVPQAAIDRAVRRRFEFDRSGGAWTINGRLAGHLDRVVARPQRAVPEIWRLVNKSGGWWHPIHVHLEFGRVLRRNGRVPPLAERDGIAKKDTLLLRGNESVDVFFQFRDFGGPYVFHCHNIEHEDMAMMARFDVV